jgi:NDP-sugar pyrophosphorylase family protein
MKAVILAAGKGTRLKPLSDYISKAMMPVANISITQRLVEQVHVETNINEFIILANHPLQDIVKHFERLHEKDESFSKMTFFFAYQAEQKGMGDAVKCVLEAGAVGEPFLLAACDSLYPRGEISSLMHRYESESLDGVLALMEMQQDKIAKSSSVQIEGGYVTGIVEKPSFNEILSNYASLPLYILSPKLLKYLGEIKRSKRGELELQDALQDWISNGGKFGYAVMPGRDTLTTISDLLSLNIRLLRSMPVESENSWDNVMVVEPVLSAKKVYIGAGSVIGPDAIIGESSKIGRDCMIKNTVIFAGSVVPDGTAIENGCWHAHKFFPA